MKRTMHHNTKIIPYSKAYRRPFPNAAEKRYYLDRAIDYALAAATSLGTVTILIFLISLA